MPTIVPVLRDAQGHDVTDVRVSLDGAPLSPESGGSVAVDPGEHVLRFERPQGGMLEQPFVARESEKDRLVVATVPAPAPPPAPPPAPAAEGRHISWAAYALGGVGVVALGVFVGLAATGQSDYDACKTGGCDVSSLETKRAAAWASLGVGVVAAGAAVVVGVMSGGTQAPPAVAIGSGGISVRF
jgi:hypothetical protein